MLTCEQASRLISDALDVRLSLRQRVGLRVHLLVCRGCANFRRQAHWLRVLAGSYADGRGAGAAHLPSDDAPAAKRGAADDGGVT